MHTQALCWKVHIYWCIHLHCAVRFLLISTYTGTVSAMYRVISVSCLQLNISLSSLVWNPINSLTCFHTHYWQGVRSLCINYSCYVYTIVELCVFVPCIIKHNSCKRYCKLIFWHTCSKQKTIYKYLKRFQETVYILYSKKTWMRHLLTQGKQVKIGAW